MIKNIHKWFLFSMLMLMLFMPIFQSTFNIFEIKPLDGSFAQIEKADFKFFTWKRWFDESFQNKINKAIEDNIGYRNILIRLYNQLNYSFFNKTLTQKAVIGKSDCLYEEEYILDYTGYNFIGKKTIAQHLLKTKKLQDFLKKDKHVDLVIIYAPGKASFFPEYIPDKYKPKAKTLSNYEYYAEMSNVLKINHLDLNKWFILMKDTSQYPLYPKYGIHWSTYGMHLAIDTIIKHIEKTKNINLINPLWKKITATDSVKDADYDIEKTLNLLFKLPSERMAYPEIIIKEDTTKDKPNVLVIADSYYWSIYNSGIPQKVFGNHEFWYYNYTIYPDCWGDNARYVDKNNACENIEKQDIILLMITELNLCRGFFNFTDELYNKYFPDTPKDEIYDFKLWYLNFDDKRKALYHKADSCRTTPEKILDKMAYINHWISNKYK